MEAIWIILGITLIISTIFIIIYNSLVAKKNEVHNIESSIDTILKKRFDLIPNLVTLIKQYTQYEGNILTKITELRTYAVKSDSLNETMKIDKKINNIIKPLMLNVENYPELKANEQFINLQMTLTELEEQLSAARRAYNQAVTDYNNALEMIPSNIIANFMNYKPYELFEIEENEKNNLDLKKLFSKNNETLSTK